MGLEKCWVPVINIPGKENNWEGKIEKAVEQENEHHGGVGGKLVTTCIYIGTNSLKAEKYDRTEKDDSSWANFADQRSGNERPAQVPYLKKAGEEEPNLTIGDTHGNECLHKGKGIPRQRKGKNKKYVQALFVSCSGKGLPANLSSNFVVNSYLNFVVLTGRSDLNMGQYLVNYIANLLLSTW